MDLDSYRVRLRRGNYADQPEPEPEPEPEHNAHPQQHQMPSMFLDKLSVEVRCIIYGYVFGPCDAITPTRRLTRKLSGSGKMRDRRALPPKLNEDLALPERRIHTKILVVNKKIYKEAISVLFATRAVRGSIVRMHELLQSRNDGFLNHVRWVHISNCNKERSSFGFSKTLGALHGLPLIRSIIVLSDCLTEVDHDSDADFIGTTVVEFAMWAMLGPIVCVGIGAYKLENKLPKVWIVNQELVDLWPAVHNTPADYDGLVDAIATIDSLGASVFGYNVPVWASQTSLRCWVDIQQQFLRLRTSGKWLELTAKSLAGLLDSATDEVRIHHFFSKLEDATRLSIATFPLLASGKHVLKDLNRSDPSELLNEAREFLASNIAACKEVSCHVTDHPRLILCPATWFADRDDKMIGWTCGKLLTTATRRILSGGTY